MAAQSHLSHAVVVVSVRHEEGGLDLATIGVLQTATEESVQLRVVVVVDGVIERDDDHLRDLVRREPPRNPLSCGGTETVRQPEENKLRLRHWKG